MDDKEGQPSKGLATDSPIEQSGSGNDSDSDGSEAYLNALQSQEAKEEGPKDENSQERKREKMSKLETFGSTSRHQESVFPENLEQMTGKTSEEESIVSFQYMPKDPRIQKDEIVRLLNEETKKLLHDRKLYLVLDLDYTLLNSTLLKHFSPEEDYLKRRTVSLRDVSKGSLFVMDCMPMMIKLRPFVRTFLKEASQMFKMYIYTMGDRTYALEMAKQLDPSMEYFRNKVISRDDSTQKHRKGLDFLPGQESAILILDDSENVWQKHKDNLILMKRYFFFASNFNRCGYKLKSLSELKTDESGPDRVLASILDVLKQIHRMFFSEPDDDDDHASRDVRQLMKKFQKEVLGGCKIVFSGVFPTNIQADSQLLWKLAVQLGATCLTELDTSVTHVVSSDCTTSKSVWALKEKKFLVNPRWIKEAKYLWQRQAESNFPVEILKGCKIFFSGVFPSQFRADGLRLWKMAEKLGATRSTELDQSVTHVVSADCRTDESGQARREKKFLVNPRWINDAKSLWRRQPEKRFPVDVLKGCKIVFSGFIPADPKTDSLRAVAEQLGATCLTIPDPSVTHVVSTNPRTEKSGWARGEKKFLVNPRWITDSQFFWQRQPEKNFPLEILKGCKFLFSGFIPTNPETDRLRNMAELLGVTCLTERDPSVTHVVSYDCRTEESDWAMREKKFLVNPRWIEDAKSFWKRQPEKKYPVQVLKGCKIVFSAIVPTNVKPDSLRKIAQQLGAVCFTQLNPSITHVVSKNPGTEKSRWALREKKFLVNPRWIEDAKSFWKKQPEKMYPVIITKHHG